MGSTHIHGHTLDLVITRQSDQIVRSTPRIDHYFPDHASVLCHLHSIKPSFTTRTLSFRKLKSVNVETLNDDLAKSDLCKNPPDDLDELVVSYNRTLTAVLDKHAPVKTRTIVVRPRVPWYTAVMKLDMLKESVGKLREDGGCRNLFPTWSPPKSSAMLLTI